jgi:pimeloyl-ACP methyl ester carboxylesterase
VAEGIAQATVERMKGAPSELRALTQLGFDELGGAAAGIGRIHRAVAQRVFRAVGPVGRPVQVAHDEIARRVYGANREASRALGGAAGAAVAVRDGTGRALSSTPQGAAALAALNGLIGDRLEAEGSALQEPMAIRVGGGIVSTQSDALARAFPDATPTLAVFLHGLMETEWSWHRRSPNGDPPYGALLADELGFTPVYVRYNTGRRISQNGRSLAELLEALVSAWPVEVERVALIGHSMGGLVARSAAHQASEDRMRWPTLVRHVISLGTPHMGAPLEQGVHWLSAALAAVPETKPFADFLRRRSGGIRDLRQGSLVDEDWRDCDPDALRAVACREVPLLDGATHCFVTATVTRTADHPVGRLVGDFLVLVPSASGRSHTRRIPFRDEDGRHVGGAHHFALLNHPAVYECLSEWLGETAELQTGTAQTVLTS